MIVQSIMWYQYHRPRPWVLLLSSSLFIQSHAFAALAQEESATTELRARLTEREQENRVKQPWTTQFLGHPLSATLQYELAYDWTRPSTRDNAAYRETRVIIEQHADFFGRIKTLIDELGHARDEALAVSTGPVGTLRLTVSVAFGHQCLLLLLPNFRALFPALKLELLLTHPYLDLVSERMDLAVRLGARLDTSLIGVKLFNTR